MGWPRLPVFRAAPPLPLSARGFRFRPGSCAGAERWRRRLRQLSLAAPCLGCTCRPRPAMARSSLSSRFRRLDIDQFDENRFVEEPDGAAGAPNAAAGAEEEEDDEEGQPGAGGRPEVEAALRQGDMLRAFHVALQNSPGNTKNPAAKVSSIWSGPRKW
ncbi:actin-related protein 2/3 complex subunit 5-like protein isoform X2 [Hemicordylus capensis]|uniref:actin-related protein 2/3 complex subunit 5-like protein isoform X2 n=1 Tax=Hemicordylus capensis TaxID=884348 RepID=UPI00230415E7|nr:actin-related protein 2/3 complex subunit 5-like protein isoform X2 [Hemicordylus capensis]